MKFLKQLLLPLLVLTVAFSVASCGKDDDGGEAVNITSATVEVGELVFTLSDGSTIRAGKLPYNSEGIRLAGAVIDGGDLIISLSDGINKKCSTLPTFTEDYVLLAASITDDGVLLLHTNSGKVNLGKLLYLSAPESPLTPSGASEYATSRDVTGRKVATVEMKIKNYGTITILLDATTAPITVENFLTLARSGFYDGLTFHGVMTDFMIQGGDPKADGTGNSANTIYGEFSSNGYSTNDLSHKRGVISMARRSYPNDSASCQFFICNADASSSLDGDYAAFGYVINGMNIVDAITEYTVPFSDTNSGTIEEKSKQAVIENITITSDLDITTVSGATVNSAGEVTLTLSNGTVLNTVSVPANPENLAFTDITLSGSRLTFNINDGYTVRSQRLPVIYGDTTGATAAINSDCHLVITVGNTEYDLGKVYYPTVPAEEMTPEGASDVAEERDLEGREYAIVEIKFRGYGTVTVLLDATAAPETVANFLSLVKSGYYNGLKMHAAITGMVMEGGMGDGELEPIYGEFSRNGYEGNDLSHKRGVLSMALTTDDDDSATSAFFICATDLSEYLDGYSASFGYVLEGMNIVDEIIELTSGYANPQSGVISDTDKQAVIESITVVRDLDTPSDSSSADGTSGNGSLDE